MRVSFFTADYSMFLTFFGLIIAGAFIFFVCAAALGLNDSLARSFEQLGDMTGKTMQEISNAVGEPSSITQLEDGTILLEWFQSNHAQTFHIAIRFVEGLFAGIVHVQKS